MIPNSIIYESPIIDSGSIRSGGDVNPRYAYDTIIKSIDDLVKSLPKLTIE